MAERVLSMIGVALEGGGGFHTEGWEAMQRHRERRIPMSGGEWIRGGKREERQRMGGGKR